MGLEVGLVLTDLGLSPLNRVKTKARSLIPPLHKINRPILALIEL